MPCPKPRVYGGPGDASAQPQKGLKRWQAVAVALGVLLALLAALVVAAAALYLRSCRRARQSADSKDPEAGKAPGAHQVCPRAHANAAPRKAVHRSFWMWTPMWVAGACPGNLSALPGPAHQAPA